MKKTIVLSSIILLFSGLNMSLSAQKEAVVDIQTSAQCEMCKDRLESNLAFEKGITKVALNMETKKISITYKTSKTDVETIKSSIAKLGYDADEVMADATAYKELPGCCKKPDDRDKHSHH